jgi:class 3 adenylate cyclase
MLDADLSGARVTDAGRELRIPRSNGAGDLVIPLASPRVSTDGVSYANLLDVPWFGGAEWETMYDWPARRQSSQHLPVAYVWNACVAREKIERNDLSADEAIRVFYELFDPDRLARYNAAPPAPDDFAARATIIRGLLSEYADFIDGAAKLKPAEMDQRTRRFVAAARHLQQVLDRTPPLIRELAGYRRTLARTMRGKAVLMGWTATAALADFVPTSLHEKCPGVVVHGVVFNGLMTGELWRRLPWWMSALTAAALGLLTAMAVGRFPPSVAFVAALVLACGFAVVNGTVLFDYGNRILGAAAPLTAIGAVWAGCTLARVAVEAAERDRITGRFRSYVDPKLVNYVLEHPEVRFDGETREMTVVFTDLAGFTALSEKLGARIVPVLNELLGELVPIVRDRHQGYVNKFLGDGIMFFFNAPVRNPHHAAEAVATVLDMRAALEAYNRRLRQRGLPELSMRAGVVTGEMIVGDAGGAQQNDYTVLGDAVNLAARLEPANKPFGTHTLVTGRTVELLDGQFLTRPVARLEVVGKDEAVMVYEPLATSTGATEQHRALASRTAELVEAFAKRRFAECITILDGIEAAAGTSKLTELYRELCEQYLREPPDESFDGRIVLTQK